MASMKKAGIKAANKVKANRKKKVVKDTMPELTSIDVPQSPPQTPISCYGDWGGVTNSHSNGIKPKK